MLLKLLIIITTAVLGGMAAEEDIPSMTTLVPILLNDLGLLPLAGSVVAAEPCATSYSLECQHFGPDACSSSKFSFFECWKNIIAASEHSHCGNVSVVQGPETYSFRQEHDRSTWRQTIDIKCDGSADTAECIHSTYVWATDLEASTTETADEYYTASNTMNLAGVIITAGIEALLDPTTTTTTATATASKTSSPVRNKGPEDEESSSSSDSPVPTRAQTNLVTSTASSPEHNPTNAAGRVTNRAVGAAGVAAAVVAVAI